jgi:hypothetical protein
MTDDRNWTRDDPYRQSRPEDRRLGITGQPERTHSWPSWINWVLPLAALAGLLWYVAHDRAGRQYSDSGTVQQQKEPARTTPPSGTTTPGNTTAPGGTTTAPSGTK